MKTVKKNVDKKLQLLTIHEKKLSDNTMCYYHDLLEIITLFLKSQQLTSGINVLVFLLNNNKQVFSLPCQWKQH